MNWSEHLAVNTCTADEAIESIRPGDALVYGQGAGVPQAINEALVRKRERYHDVSIYHMLYPADPIHLQRGMEKHFRLRSSFLDAHSREAVNEGRADFFPCYFHQLPAMFDSGQFAVDVAVLQLSLPDDDGYCSYGVTLDYIQSAVRNARVVVAELNHRMPRTAGPQNRIHVTALHRIVEVDYPLPQVDDTPVTQTEQMIANYCASLIDDGATLQVGIGAIPDAVLRQLGDRKDLGIHTELFTPGLVPLIEKGVANGSRKTLHPGKALFTFMMGKQHTYHFAHNNPWLEAYPVDYLNAPSVIAQNDKLVSINSFIEVDLSGQVAAESIGTRMISGVGGQADFIRGARLSKGGRSILAAPATAAAGSVSRIVPCLQPGAAVSTSRNDVDCVITEYGIAHLRGQSLRERGKRLAAIAHPQFREGLERALYQRYPML